MITIDTEFSLLQQKFSELEDQDQKNIADILALLIAFIDKQKIGDKPYLSEVKRYLHNKQKRDKSINWDLLSLKDWVITKGSIPKNKQDDVERTVWAILPELAYFQDTEVLNKILFYVLARKITKKGITQFVSNDEHREDFSKDKASIIKKYQTIYHNRFGVAEKKRRLRELALHTFVETNDDELKHLQKKLNLTYENSLY
jgi:hypothetical protein